MGGLALGYFLVMSTFALGIGLLVGNLISPGTGLNVQGDPGAGAELAGEAEAEGGMLEFFQNIVPTSLLVFMMVASKGAAGVSGAGLATLAAGLQSHRPELLDGIGLIVGIDKFMSEARALTNFSGNAVATVLIGAWTQTWDPEQMAAVLNGDKPFDEQTMVDDHPLPNSSEDRKPELAGAKPKDA